MAPLQSQPFHIHSTRTHSRVTRSDPEPPSYPEANEEALELSAGDGDAILDAMIAETDDSTDSQVSDQSHPPILANRRRLSAASRC